MQICLPLLCLFFLFSLYHSSHSQVDFSEKKRTSAPLSTVFPLDKIGQGSLSLHSSVQKKQIPEMSKEVFLLASNLRPGIQNKDIEYILSLKSSKERCKIKHGEKIYINCDSVVGTPSPIYHFSEQETPLWVKPLSLDKHKTLLEVGLLISSKETANLQEEKTQFLLKEDHNQIKSEEKPTFLNELEQAKLWGQDVVLSCFSSDNYKELQDKVKLEIQTKNRTIFCFIGKGDCLQWSEEGWAPIELSQNISGKPLAQVHVVTQKSVDIEVWDAEGFCSFSIKLEIQPVQRCSIKTELLPNTVRMRTSKQLSCCFGKQRHLIKEGDWMLKTSRGWKNLKRAQDKKDYLHHKITGEVLIFHSLIKEQGKLQVKGFWIDPMRTQAQPFTIPVLSDAQIKTSLHATKKSPLLHKTQDTSMTYLPPQLQHNKEGSP